MKICSIDGCGNHAKARGWCNAHCQRWARHGDPLAGRVADGEPERFYREIVLTYEGDECLTWPYGKGSSGYGKIYLGSKKHVVSRLVCEERHGPPPTPKHEAAHSCGRGHLACVTKRHLSWKTPKENQIDRIAHGTSNRGERHGNSTLTEPQVQVILSLKGQMSQRKIAAAVGVSQSNVSLIHSRKNWGWLGCGELSLSQLKRGIPASELELLEVDPDAEDET